MIVKRLVYILLIISLAILVVSCGILADTTPPRAPANVTMKEPRFCSISLMLYPIERWMHNVCKTEELIFRWDAASDEGSGVASYRVRLDSDVFIEIGNATTYNIGTDAISDGSHTFEVRAVDDAGNEGIPGKLSFKINVHPPIILDVRASSNVTDGIVTINWTTNEPTYGSIGYRPVVYNYTLDIEEWFSYADILGLSTNHTVALRPHTSDTGIVYRPPFWAGTYEFWIKSTDEAGNAAISGSYTVAVP